MRRIPYHQLKAEFLRVLKTLEFTPDKAESIADIFASNSRDGVYSHGLNRFPLFVEYVQKGFIRKDAEPELEAGGLIEQWNGNLGPGVLNAKFCMDRAIQIAKENGIGCVALRNTNHWMRGGTYGWQAAEAGCIGICFTNTIANMPPWGGTEARLGNNPLIIAVPRKEGHIVLDMAMSLYSYGKLNEYALKGKELPYEGGFNEEGVLTKNPSEIIESRRALPIGLWKGSGLSLIIDILVSVLSNGRTTGEVTAKGEEYGLSQVFICLYKNNEQERERLLNEILSYTKSSASDTGNILYPGENSIKTRRENMEKGIPVDESMWQKLLEL